ILAEVQALVDQGVTEVTLLGQNVNSYGVNFADPDLPRDKFAFSKLLRAVGAIEGLERLRFTSPHRSEEHTSELQSRFDLVCRLLLEKNKRRERGTEAIDRRRKQTSSEES